MREPGTPPPAAETATGFDFGSYGRIGVGSDGAATRATRPTSSRTARASRRRPISSSTSTTRARSAATRTALARGAGAGVRRRRSVPLLGRLHLAPRHPQRLRRDEQPRRRRAVAVGRLAHVPRRRHLPLRLLAARQPQHRRRRRRYEHKKFDVALHAGLNRLDDLYQYETLDTPPRGLGPPGKSTVLDRPRFVSSLKLSSASATFPAPRCRSTASCICCPRATQTDADHAAQDGAAVGPRLGRRRAARRLAASVRLRQPVVARRRRAGGLRRADGADGASIRRAR